MLAESQLDEDAEVTSQPVQEMIAVQAPSQALPITVPVGQAHTLAGEYMDDVYKLSEGRAFILRWPASMSAEEFEEFTDWITLLQRKLKRSIPKPSIQ